MRDAERVKSAVILAAEMGLRLNGVAGGTPKGFLRLGGRPIVHWSIQKLLSAGLEDILIVTGYAANSYEELARGWSAIRTVQNAEYADSGSMYSLYCARKSVRAPFLLVESDLIYEMRALEALLESSLPNAVLISEPLEDGGGMYVQASEGRVRRMSREPSELVAVDGQLVGISKVSAPMLAAMVKHSESFFREKFYQLDYEDCVSRVTDDVELHACRVDDLLWTRVDNDERLLRATNRIFPQIWARDGGPPPAVSV